MLPGHHLTVVEGITTTRVPRTLVDLAGVLHPSRTERAVDNCLAARTATVGTLRAAFIEPARPGRKGIALMRRLLDERNDGYVPPASDLEACFLALLPSGTRVSGPLAGGSYDSAGTTSPPRSRSCA